MANGWLGGREAVSRGGRGAERVGYIVCGECSVACNWQVAGYVCRRSVFGCMPIPTVSDEPYMSSLHVPACFTFTSLSPSRDVHPTSEVITIAAITIRTCVDMMQPPPPPTRRDLWLKRESMKLDARTLSTQFANTFPPCILLSILAERKCMSLLSSLLFRSSLFSHHDAPHLNLFITIS